MENLISSPSLGWSPVGHVHENHEFFPIIIILSWETSKLCLLAPQLPQGPRSWSWLQTLDALRSSGHVFVDPIFKRTTRNINSNFFLLRVTLLKKIKHETDPASNSVTTINGLLSYPKIKRLNWNSCSLVCSDQGYL